MGMYYCSGCDRHHDSKDGEYNLAKDGKEYCDATVPVEKKAQHTPGPWFWAPAGTSTILLADIGNAPHSGKPVGFLTSRLNDGFSPEHDKNALLIAAAPELLEALIEVVALANEQDEHTGLMKARAAIAKARGEA